MITSFLRLFLFGILAASAHAESLRDEMRAFASEIDGLEYTVEKFDRHEDFISLRFGCFIRRSHISGLIFDDSSVRVLLSSGHQIVITPESSAVSPVIVHEALTWILISGKHKYKSATFEQQKKARDLIKRAIAESKDPVSSRLGLAQSFWCDINSWSSIASKCKFEITTPRTSKSE